LNFRISSSFLDVENPINHLLEPKRIRLSWTVARILRLRLIVADMLGGPALGENSLQMI